MVLQLLEEMIPSATATVEDAILDEELLNRPKVKLKTDRRD